MTFDVASYQRKYFQDNRDRLMTKNRKWAKEHPERVAELSKKWKTKNPERRKAIAKKWRDENKERQAASAKIRNALPETRIKTQARVKKYKLENPDYLRSIYLKSRFGITLEQWNELFNKQNKSCAGCGTDKPSSKAGWHTDHDHKTGIIRGILCWRCNLTLGQVNDNIDVLKLLIIYLENSAQPKGELV